MGFARGRSGWTAAQLAMDNGHEEIVEMIQTHIGEAVEDIEPILDTTAKAWPKTRCLRRDCFERNLPLPLQEKLLADVSAEEGGNIMDRFETVGKDISWLRGRKGRRKVS